MSSPSGNPVRQRSGREEIEFNEDRTIALSRIRSLRKAKKKTQVSISTMLGMDQGSYSKAESGQIGFTIAQLQMLADFFGTSLDYICGRTNEKRPYPKPPAPEDE